MSAEEKACIVIWMLFAGLYGFSNKAMSSKSRLDTQTILPNVPGIEIAERIKVEKDNENLLVSSFSGLSSAMSSSVTSLTNNSEQSEDPMSQVTSVSQLKDVQPTDWAFQSLQSLVERYGCITGYPDGNYRGNRALTRYEFAAGLNACLNRVNELIATATADAVTREDLARLGKLKEEFATELTALRGRVDNLEARSAKVAANQFSTTTKLLGISIVGVQGRSNNRGDIAPRDGKKDTRDSGTNTNVINLNQLYLTTQFDPQSYLVTGLLAANGGTDSQLTNNVILGYEFSTKNQLVLSDLRYHRLIAKNFAVMVGSSNVNMSTAFRGPNRVENAATGSLSLFSQRNPILNIGFVGQAGIAFDWQFTKRASIQALYNSFNAANPGKRSGLFDGNTTAAVQLLVTPIDAVDVSLYYLNNYSSNGCLLTFVGDNCLTAINPTSNKKEPLQTNAVGTTVNWQLSPKVTLGAWGGYTKSNIPGRSGNVESRNYKLDGIFQLS
jgi:hypothetical protein